MCAKNNVMVLQLSDIITKWVVGHAELSIGKMNTTPKEEFIRFSFPLFANKSIY